MTACTPPLQSSRAPPGFTTVDSCRSIDQYEEARLHELRSLSISDRNTLFPSSESPHNVTFDMMRTSLDPFQFVMIGVTGWMNQQQLQLIYYLREREPSSSRATGWKAITVQR